VSVLTAANPVGEAVFGLLQDTTLQSATGGRVYDDLPEDTPRPCVFYEVVLETDRRGFGTGNLPEITLLTHVFSELGSLSEAQTINQQIVAVLKDQPLTVTGFAMCGQIVYRETVVLRDQELNGVKVHEIVSNFVIYVEQT
jgi:hypothetical protein